MAKNATEQPDYQPLKSIRKVFSLFKFRFKFDHKEVTDVSIQFNPYNKTVTYQFFETVTICILTVYIKAVVFHHVGLSWMIETKEQ